MIVMVMSLAVDIVHGAEADGNEPIAHLISNIS